MLGFNFLGMFGGEISFVGKCENSLVCMFVIKYKYYFCWFEGIIGI